METLLASTLRKRLMLCLLLATAVFLTFSPVLRDSFTGYDDPVYVTNNPHVTTGLSRGNIGWAFTSSYASNWHPLTWISHQLDCALYGLHPAGHHLTNLLLHIANTVLLFLWLTGLTGATGRSAVVALAFGVHPLHVESVAWIAERKDVLSTFFALLALLAYTAYVRRPSTVRYIGVALLFAASLASKPMMVTLPLLLVLLDWWPLRRTALLEKVPLLLLSVLTSAAAFWAQRTGASVSDLGQLPLAMRLSNAALSYLRYLGKAIWPVNLAVFYPFPRLLPVWQTAICVLALAGVTALAIRLHRDRPWVAMGWGWYGIALLPVIGVVQVGMQAMADRYMYVPLIGLLIAIAWTTRETKTLYGLSVAVLAVWAVLSWRQCHVWQDGVTLFTHAVEVTSGNFVAHDNLGVELDRLGRPEEALAHYREAVRIQPGDRNATANFAQANFAAGARLLEQGKFRDSIDRFHEGLQLRPRNALAHAYLGLAQASLGQYRDALRSFDTALQLDPQQVLAQRARAQLLPLLKP
jgi:tetratricopeptide (TPR) repeat protein